MSLLRRRLMASYSQNDGVLLHRWTAREGCLDNGIWPDEVRNSKYAHPINWYNIGAIVQDGCVVASGDRYLLSNDFTDAREKWGKYWEIVFLLKKMEPNPAAYQPQYIIDLASVQGTPDNTAADGLAYTNTEFVTNTKLYNNRFALEVGLYRVPLQSSGHVRIGFGVKKVGQDFARHFIRVGNKLYFNSNPFQAREIGNDVPIAGACFIGRAMTNGFYMTDINIYIKQISIYRKDV